MKKLFASLLLLACALPAMADPYDLRVMQIRPDGLATEARIVTVPPSAGNGVLMYNGAAQLPVLATLGGGCALAANVFSCPGNLDYNALINRPTLFNGAYSSLTGIPSTFAPAAHTQAWSTITATPATLSGYGITDGATAASVALKFNIPTGSTSQYLRGDGSVANFPTIGRAVVGTTEKAGSFRVYKSVTVAAGVGAVHFTDDGTATGNALFAEVYLDSVQVQVSDAAASYQMAWAFSNSNKTLTVTANKLTTANILTGLLGQAQANGAVVKIVVEGR